MTAGLWVSPSFTMADALSPEQLEKMQTRTQDQLDGERLAGIAEWQGRPLGNQNLHGILNKDTPCGIFRKAFVQVNDLSKIHSLQGSHKTQF
jgi:hypothetical protein